MPCTPFDPWLDIIKIVIPSTLVIVGWIIVNQLTIVRENERLRREIVTDSVDVLINLVDKILVDAYKYHTTNSRDLSLEKMLKIKLQDFGERLAGLEKIAPGSQLQRCTPAMIKLRQAITKTHFEDGYDGACEENSPILEGIAEACLGIKRCLVELKHALLT